MTSTQIALDHADFLNSQNIERILASIDADGYAVIRNAFSEREIAEAKEYIDGELLKHRGEYFSFVGVDAMRGTLLERIGRSHPFRSLLAALSTRIIGCTIEPDQPFQVLRVVSGGSGLKESMRFHYDAFAVTALVPIAIPKIPGEPCGDLVLYPSLRPIRSLVLINILEKALLQNRLAQRLFATRFMRRWLKAKLLRIDPGNIYVFRGYQSLHANEPCNPKRMRATALFHLGDPHANSFLTKKIMAVRKRKEAQKARALVS